MSVETKSATHNQEQTRLAAIDIGSNSIRSIIVEADPKGNFRVLDDEKAVARPGEGLTETRFIYAVAKDRAIDGAVITAK